MQRLGRRNRPFYRIAAIDQRTRRNGRVLEALGVYDPVHPDAGKQIQLNEERLKYWLSVGAQPSETVRDMLAKRSIGDLKQWEAERAYDRAGVAKRAAAAAAAGEAEKKA